MAALMTRRGLIRHLGDFNKIIACQSKHLSYCRRKYTLAVIDRHFNTNLHLNTCILSPTRHFCDRVGQEQKRSSDETNTDSKDKSDEKSEEEKKAKSKYLKYVQYGALGWCSCMLVWVTLTLGEPPKDVDGNPIEDEYSKYNVVYAYLMRAYRYIFVQVKITQEPSRQKLLPDPLTYPYIQPPYTLVIELTDILVHPEWTYKTGWRFKKRPGIDYFLRVVGPPTFEVVIFTKESGMTADPIVSKIDPENFIMYRLYRDATRYQEGEHIKDLNCLNRDLSRVIMIDWNKQASQLNSDNAFTMKKWTGDMTDTALGELAEFLRAIAVSKVDDVRPVLKYYSQFDDPLAKFHENQAKLKEEQERQAHLQQSRNEKSVTSMWNRLRR